MYSCICNYYQAAELSINLFPSNNVCQVEREAISKTVKKTRFANLVVGGATDSAVMEQDIVFVRICNAGQVTVSFVGIENTPKSDAVGVTASVVRAVERGLSIDMADFHKKFVAIATDGASVMTATRAGVVALLKGSQPSLVGIHCFSHRLELACRDVMKSHPSYQELEKFLLDIYLFDHNRYVKIDAMNCLCVA